jgi:RNA polymerase sigma-70 factor (ECF subfamily)
VKSFFWKYCLTTSKAKTFALSKTYEKQTDSELAALIVKGNPLAYQALFYRYYDTLFRFFWQRTTDEEMAKDGVQDVFARVWQNRDKLNPDLSLKAYLYRIAGNRLIDHFRKEKNTVTVSDEEGGYEPSYDPLATFAVDHDVKKALSELPENIREVFLMNRYDGLKYREIAELLKVSVKTVEIRMSKGLKILREKLAHLKTIIIIVTILHLFL